jgi:hypothetical protein
LNFDASITLRMERLPVVGRFVKKNSQRFPDGVAFGDIVKGLPLPDGSADGIYASHVLEASLPGFAAHCLEKHLPHTPSEWHFSPARS